MDIPPRAIVREEEFEEQLAALLGSLEEADEGHRGGGIDPSADSEIGLPASADGTIWALAMPPIRGRQATLYYAFDAETVFSPLPGGGMKSGPRVEMQS